MGRIDDPLLANLKGLRILTHSLKNTSLSNTETINVTIRKYFFGIKIYKRENNCASINDNYY